MVGGTTITTACTLAKAVMLTVGMFVAEDLRLMMALTFPAASGGTVLTITSNTWPG